MNQSQSEASVEIRLSYEDALARKISALLSVFGREGTRCMLTRLPEPDRGQVSAYGQDT